MPIYVYSESRNDEQFRDDIDSHVPDTVVSVDPAELNAISVNVPATSKEDLDHFLEGEGFSFLHAVPVDIEGSHHFGDFSTANEPQGIFLIPITAVADVSISTVTITSVTDSSGNAQFNFTPGPTLVVGQYVQPTGFVTNELYNVERKVTVVGIGTFELQDVVFGSSESGSFTSRSVEITAAAHGEVDGESIIIIDTTSYNGNFDIYNALTNTFEIRSDFVATETGNVQIGVAATGDTGFNTDLNKPVYFDGTVWLPVLTIVDALAFPDASTQTQAAIPGGIPFNLKNLHFENSEDVSAEVSSVRGMWMSQDGLKLYIADVTTQNGFEYDMTVPWDSSTLVYSGNSINIGTNMTDITLKPDGTKVWFMTFAGDFLEFTLSTPFDFSTAGSSTTRLTAAASTNGVVIKPDGLSLYFSQEDGDVLHWTMSSPYDLSTLTDTGEIFVSGITVNSTDLIISDDGRRFILCGNSPTINLFGMIIPWDITSGFPIDTVDITGGGNILNTCYAFDNSKLFFIGANDTIEDYAMGRADDILVYEQSPTVIENILDNATRPASWGHILTGKFVAVVEDTALPAPLLGMDVSADGLKYFMAGNDPGINVYNMTTPFDITTGSLETANTFNAGFSIQSIAFSPDGLHLIVVQGGGLVRFFTLGAPFDLDDTTQGASITLAEHTTNFSSCSSSADGRFFFINDQSGDIFQYSRRNWTEQNLIYTGNTFNFSTTSNTQCSTISGDGKIMYFKPASDTLREYTLTTPWDVSTAILVTTDTAFFDNDLIREIRVTNDGTLLFAASTDLGDGDMGQYSLGLLTTELISSGLVEGTNITATDTVTLSDGSTQSIAVANIGSVENSLVSAFSSVLSEESSPSGISFSPDGLKMYILGTSSTDVNQYDLPTAWSVVGNTFDQAFDISTEINIPQDLFFKPDGTKFYVLGTFGTDIAEYDTATSGDVSGSSVVNTFDISGQDSDPRGLWFKPDGTEFYTCGITNDNVYRYVLTIPWDVSTAAFSQSFSVSGEGTSAVGLGFTNDGRSMFITFGTDDIVQQYTLTTPWSITTAVAAGSTPTSHSQPDGLFIADAVNKFFYTESNNNRAVEVSIAGLTGFYNSEGLIDMAPNGGRNVDLINSDQGGLRFATDIISNNRTTYFQNNDEIDIVASNISGEERIDVSHTNGIQLSTGATGLVPTIDGLSISKLQTTTIEIFTTAEFDALASGGVITIAGDTSIKILGNITSTSRIEVTGGDLIISGDYTQTATLTYSGTATFITVVGGFDVRARARLRLNSSSTGTLVDYQGVDTFSGLAFSDISLTGWDNLGTIEKGFLVLNFVQFLFLSGSFKLIDSNMTGSDIATVFASSTFIDFSSTDGTVGLDTNITLLSSFLGSAPFLRIDPLLSADRLLFTSIETGGAGFFDTTGGTSGAYTVVADNSIASTAIGSVTDNGGNAVFNHAGTDPELGSTVTLSGYVTNTDYNGAGVVSAVAAGTFEVTRAGVNIAFGTDEASGAFVMVGITLTSTAHGLSQDDTLTLSGDASTDYDNGYRIYNVQTNTFDVAATFISTELGTWDTAGLDQTNPNVLALNAIEDPSSNYIATAFVNDNSTANGAIVNNTFTDLVFGTAGTALSAGSTIERWKLIDELNGTFEYSGNEPFDGFITFDFTVESSGGTVDFRFKWEHDVGAGFVDLPDDVESLVAVGSDAQSVTKTFPLEASSGDQIKPQITRNSGTSGITTTYATIYATQ